MVAYSTFLSALFLTFALSAQAAFPELAPGSPPRSVNAQAVNSTTVSVTWDEPEIPNGHIKGYKVFYTPNADLPLNLWSSVDVSTKMAAISNLEPNHTYTISVLAFSQVGEGPMSDPVKVFTTQRTSQQLLPPQLQNLRQIRVTPNEISLAWDPPDDVNSINHYKLHYNDTYYRRTVSLSIPPHTHSFELKDLTPNTVYHIQFSAISGSGEGARTPAIQVRTKDFIPGKPRRVRIRNLNSTVVRIDWRPPVPKDKKGIIRGYHVYYVSVNNKGEPTSTPRVVDTIDGDKHDYVITGLDPNTRYRFQVAAYTRKGGGSSSNPRTLAPTKSVPSMPHSLKVQLHQEDPPRVNLTWQQPRESHGQIEAYRVTWWNKGEERESIWHGTKSSFITGILDKGVVYEFRVSARNSVDFGHTAIATIRIPAGIPAGAPQNFTAHDRSETNLQLTWDLPAKNLRNGQIVMYQIAYLKLSEPDSVNLINVTDTSMDITDLEMDTDYIFQIKAFTRRGAGPWSRQLASITAGQKELHAPQNIQIERSSPTSLLVTWDKPNFPVKGYKIYYSMFAMSNMVLWNRLEIGPYTVAEITHLRENTIYAVRVQAKSIDGQYGNLSKLVQSDSTHPGTTTVSTSEPETGDNCTFMESCDDELLRIERKRLTVDTLRLGVERERLAVETARLDLERERVQFERECGRQCCASTPDIGK